MTVDFEFRKSPAMRLATVAWTGNWNEKRIQSEFEKIDAWAKKKGHRTGKWVFMEPSDKHWKVGIELKGKARGEGRVHLTTLPATKVACVVYNPDVISPRVIYHGLTDWLRWRRKDGDIKRAGTYREVYDANPWRNPKAWANSCIQVTVR
ncbi:MAG: GyrI-like domain-containing protein [Thermoplasmata archaeon]|nr:GyrI-like domain-containing protein [Thermoplasmata archaeon]